MKLQDLIDELMKIKKDRGGKVDVLIHDNEYSEYREVKRIQDVSEFGRFPKHLRRDKSIEIMS